MPQDLLARGLGAGAGSVVDLLRRSGKLHSSSDVPDRVRRLVEAKASGEVTPMDAVKASALLPLGKAGSIMANVAEKGVPVVVPFAAGGLGVMRVGGKTQRVSLDPVESLIEAISKTTHATETQASKEALARELSSVSQPRFETVRMTSRDLRDATTGGNPGIIEPNLTGYGRRSWNVDVPTGTLAEQRAAVERSIAQSLDRTGVSTIGTRQRQELDSINKELQDAGIDPLPGINDVRMHSEVDSMARPKAPSIYGRETVSRNADIATATHGNAAGYGNIIGVTDPTLKMHIMENDHFMGTGFATWFIKKTKPEIVTQDWRDETAAFLNWINSGDNMQRVGRLWNQFKNGQEFETAMKEFQKKYPTTAEGQFIDPYMDYVSDTMSSLHKALGTEKARSVISSWKSPEWARTNAGIQEDRKAYIKAARGMKDKVQGYQALLDRGFSEEEAAGIIYG